MSSTACPNCQAEVAAQFCPQCGQPRLTGRITLGHMLHQLWDEVISIESPFFRTAIALSYKPGAAIHDYLAGKRKAYYRPVQYFLVCMGLYLLVRSLLHYDPIAVNIQAGYLAPAIAKDPTGQFVTQYINHLSLIGVLLLALYLRLFYSGPQALTWGEAIVVSFFAMGHYILFYTLLIPLVQVLPVLIRYTNWLYILLITAIILGLWPATGKWWRYAKALLVGLLAFWSYVFCIYFIAAGMMQWRL